MPEPGSPAASEWFVALGEALTGERLVPPDAEQVSASVVVAWLADQGWSASRLQKRRATQRDRGVAWPGAVSQGLGPGTAARFHALLAQVRELTGTIGLVVTQRPEHRVLDAGDRRLLAEVPPHHGSV